MDERLTDEEIEEIAVDYAMVSRTPIMGGGNVYHAVRMKRDDVIEFARAVIARAAVPTTWQPIETAPKDADFILLAAGDHVSVGGWTSDLDCGADWEGQIGMAGWWVVDSLGGCEPTHWMPLPAAPLARQEPAAAQPSGSEALRTIGAAGPLGDPEVMEPFWCHEQSHDRPRCDAQCAECAEYDVALPRVRDADEPLPPDVLVDAHTDRAHQPEQLKPCTRGVPASPISSPEIPDNCYPAQACEDEGCPHHGTPHSHGVREVDDAQS